MLRGTGVAALAAGAAVVPFATKAAGKSTEQLVRDLARTLLCHDDNRFITMAARVERKRIANIMLVMIGDKPQAWQDYELEVVEELARQADQARRVLS